MCTDHTSITGKTPACVSNMKMRHMYNGDVAITLALAKALATFHAGV